jgi:hypothetical protein
MLLAEPDQMVLFDNETYGVLSPETLHAPVPSQYSGAGLALGLALIALSWLPIALLIWFLT